MVPNGTGQVRGDTLEEQWCKGFWFTKKSLSWRQEARPPSLCSEPNPRGACPTQFPGGGVGEKDRAEQPPPPSISCPKPLPSLWGLRGLGALRSRWFLGGDAPLPAPSLPAALRAASLGEIGIYHLAQLCRQVSQCFKGTFSCDFSQLKRWI